MNNTATTTDTDIDIDDARTAARRMLETATESPGRKPADKKAKARKAKARAAARSAQLTFSLGCVNEVPDPDLCKETSLYAHSALGLGERAERHIGHLVAWDPEIKAWRVYTGTHWIIDYEGVHVNSLFFAVCRSTGKHEVAYVEATSETVIEAERKLQVAKDGGLSTKEYEDALKDAQRAARRDAEDFAQRCEDNATYRRTALAYLKTKTIKPGDVWDQHTLLVNAPNGTYHVGKRLLREHRPADYITRITAVDIDLHAPIAPDVQKMLDHAERQGAGTAKMMTRYSGLCLTGVTDAASILTITGPSRSSKSTWWECLYAASGGMASSAYGAMVSPSAFEKSATRSGSGHSDALDRLADHTWAFLDESQGCYFDAEMLKNISAGGFMTTSAKGGRNRTWESLLKLVLAANGGFHFPADDLAFLLRLLPTDYAVPVPLDEKDEHLKHRLKKEKANLVSMLAMCLHAASDWYEEYQEAKSEGLKDPARVALSLPENLDESRAQYGANANPLYMWLEDRAHVGQEAGLQKQHGQLGKADTATWLTYYNATCHLYGRKQLPGDRFAAYLNALGHTTGNPTDVTHKHSAWNETMRMKGKRVRQGIRFASENDWFAFGKRYVENDNVETGRSKTV